MRVIYMNSALFNSLPDELLTIDQEVDKKAGDMLVVGEGPDVRLSRLALHR